MLKHANQRLLDPGLGRWKEWASLFTNERKCIGLKSGIPSIHAIPVFEFRGGEWHSQKLINPAERLGPGCHLPRKQLKRVLSKYFAASLVSLIDGGGKKLGKAFLSNNYLHKTCVHKHTRTQKQT